tara:strand:+ start:99 stop:347 length:249 start_codon:yes stop_codon:yes gene_type:complete
MSARKVGYYESFSSLRDDDDASLSVSGVAARSVFLVFVSPSDDDEKDDDDKWKLETRIARAMMMMKMMIGVTFCSSFNFCPS